MVSTPNGLFGQIEKENESICIYKRIKLDYKYSLGKIFTKPDKLSMFFIPMIDKLLFVLF
ncbi:MAG: hypothetical protein DLM72_14080 [Candidatus Nitrosopolaris wilkensis]|nr:MAG: hypothetical protein DLM72_14080 [Candidatus Nitrosopolaris wilkensis]